MDTSDGELRDTPSDICDLATNCSSVAVFNHAETVNLDCVPNCRNLSGWQAEAIANPPEGYAFEGWDCRGVSCPLFTYGNPISLTLYNDVLLAPRYAKKDAFSPPYRGLSGVVLDNSAIGGNAIATCEPDCLLESTGFWFHVRAFSDAGYEFDSWRCEEFGFGTSRGRCLDLGHGHRIAEEAFDAGVDLFGEKDSLGDSIVSQEILGLWQDGVILLKPLFRASPGSPGTPLEINLPTEFTSHAEENINYAVLNDSTRFDTETYRRVARNSTNAWSEINPHLKFKEVDEDSPDLNFIVRFVDAGSGLLPSNGAGYCCPTYDHGVPEAIIVGFPAILHGGVVVDAEPGRLVVSTDENRAFCKQQGYLPALSAGLINVTVHEIGHHLGLGHHFYTNHVLGGSSPPLYPFDAMGLHIPNELEVENSFNTDWNAEYQGENYADKLQAYQDVTSPDLLTRSAFDHLHNIELERERLKIEYESLRISLVCGGPIESQSN